MIRILLADDHKMMREGMRAVLSKQYGMRVIAEAEGGAAAVELAAQLKPDVVLMDISMPDLNGIDATRKIRAANDAVRVIGVTMHENIRYSQAMYEAGASALLLKGVGMDKLVAAIRAVMSGRSPTVPPGPEAAATTDLTRRERQVLRLIAEGHSSREAGVILHISADTVDSHRKNIMKKWGIHSVAELTKLAVREGLTPLE
jgi:DNA-binding NarL/FixJ family response regulator